MADGQVSRVPAEPNGRGKPGTLTAAVAPRPERMEALAMDDLIRFHREAVKLAKVKGLSPNQETDVLKIRLAVDQALLDRSRDKPRPEPPPAETLA